MGSLQWEIVYSMQNWVSDYKRKKSMDHITLVRESLQSQEPSGAEFTLIKWKTILSIFINRTMDFSYWSATFLLKHMLNILLDSLEFLILRSNKRLTTLPWCRSSHQWQWFWEQFVFLTCLSLCSRMRSLSNARLEITLMPAYMFFIFTYFSNLEVLPRA